MSTAPAFGRITNNSDRGAAALKAITSRLKLDRMFNGGWFRKFAIDHMKKHAAETPPGHWDRLYPGLDADARADAIIRKVCGKAAVAGAFASTGASTGELIALFTEGLGAPVGVPAAVVSMVAEAGYTAMLQIDLACDLGSVYGVPFDVDDIGDLTTLFGLALELPPPVKGQDHAPAAEGDEGGKGIIARLVELEDGEIGRRIGRKMLEESVMRNIIPIVGIGISARWNYVATKKLAGTVRRYIRYRRALHDALMQLRFENLAEPQLIVEGAWLLATVEGPAPSEVAMAVGLIVEALPEHAHKALVRDATFGDSEEEWFDQVRKAPRSMHAPLLDVLYLVAAANRELQSSERRFLHRVGKALDVSVDLGRVEKICDHLAHGKQLPRDLAVSPA